MRRMVIAVVVLAVAGLLAWQIYHRIVGQTTGGAPLSRSGKPVVPVEVAPVEKATLRDVAHFTGSLVARSSFVVAPKTAGRLEKLNVNIGDRVTHGQVIGLLDDEEYSQQVEQAKAELAVAQANVEEARSALEAGEREYERVQALRAKNIASESERDASEARYQGQTARLKVAIAQVAQKEAALKVAEARHSYTRIVASWEGGGESRFVGERFVDEGAMLRANDPIVSILDLSSLSAVIHVIERDYAKVRLGQQATVATDAYPGMSFSGTVARVAPLLKEASRQARVGVNVPNPEGLLKPGMFVRVQIEFGRAEDATVAPRSALVRRDGQQGVFLADLEDRKAHFVPVKTGIVDGNKVQILDPPLSGMLVTMGYHLLEDGSPILVAQEEEEGDQARASVAEGTSSGRPGAAPRARP